MAAVTSPSYSHIKLHGPVSIKRLDETTDSTPPQWHNSWLILLMGMTGTGKSAFIQSLDPETNLGICGDSLESITHSVEAYKVHNVTDMDGAGIYLLDTPGLSDETISEARVVSMIQEWLAERGLPGHGINDIVYFDRITDVRMPGSKKRSMDTFKAIAGIRSAHNLTIATTMWDQLVSGRARERAQEQFRSMEDGCWKEFVENGCRLTKFENTQASALDLLEVLSDRNNGAAWYEFEEVGLGNRKELDAAYAPLVYRSLMERRQTYVLRKKAIEDELRGDGVVEDPQPEIALMLVREKDDVERKLGEVERDILNFGPPKPHWNTFED